MCDYYRRIFNIRLAGASVLFFAFLPKSFGEKTLQGLRAVVLRKEFEMWRWSRRAGWRVDGGAGERVLGASMQTEALEPAVGDPAPLGMSARSEWSPGYPHATCR